MARRRDSKGRFLPKRGRSSSGPSKAKLRRHAKNMPRDSKGRFLPKGRRSRSRSSSRRSYRRNPAMPPVVDMLWGGTIEAGQILVGKAAARSVPDMAGLPKEGNVGLAVQAAMAVGLGWAADMFLSPNAARAILAGGLTAPLETLIVAYQVPWLSTALSPTTANAEVQAYVQRGVSSYVPASAQPQAAAMQGYVPRSGSRYEASSGAMGYA